MPQVKVIYLERDDSPDNVLGSLAACVLSALLSTAAMSSWQPPSNIPAHQQCPMRSHASSVTLHEHSAAVFAKLKSPFAAPLPIASTASLTDSRFGTHVVENGSNSQCSSFAQTAALPASRLHRITF